MGKWLYTTNESQEVSPFPVGDHKVQINRRAQGITNTRQKKNIKDPQKNTALEPRGGGGGGGGYSDIFTHA